MGIGGAAVDGAGWVERRGTARHALASNELEYRAERALWLPQLSQQSPAGVDLLAAVVDAGDDHPAGLDVGVERLEVRAVGETERRLDVERRADIVADLLAKLDLDPLGAMLEGSDRRA